MDEVYAGIDKLMKHAILLLLDNVIIMKDFNAKIGDSKECKEVGTLAWAKEIQKENK